MSTITLRMPAGCRCTAMLNLILIFINILQHVESFSIGGSLSYQKHGLDFSAPSTTLGNHGRPFAGQALLSSIRSSENMVIDTNPNNIDAAAIPVDLEARTWQSLDFQVLLDGLAKYCQTAMGQRKARAPHFAGSAAEARARYTAVREVWDCVDPVPLRSGMDVEAQLALAAQGTVLEVPELREVAAALEGLAALRKWLDGSINEKASIPTLKALGEDIRPSEQLVALLDGAFDEEGELSGKKFPRLGALREGILRKKQQIRSMMSSLLASAEFTAMLADPQVQELEGRYVVAVKPTYKRSVGIVHGDSRSGKTVYVEPAQVVEPTNELKELSIALKAEESRLLADMTLQIANNKEGLQAALAATGELDLACARARLGNVLGAAIPEVGEEGVVRVGAARNPALALLRGPGKVVPNDLALGGDGSTPALVLTGPNAGGKTIVLKTLGLMALAVRSGIPLPCGGKQVVRFDYFPTVLADIGDLQSVSAELSTFSGHLVVCRAVLDAAQGTGALVLMDEMGSGTDPAQGAALAQALLEALLDQGARVALTTHYLQLKELAAAAPARFSVAAMQFDEGRPTYRLIPGAVGESFALAVAERLRLPDAVVARARDLLDENELRVSELIRELEEERNALMEAAGALEREKAAAAARERAAEEAREAAERAAARAKKTVSMEYAKRFEALEQQLKDVLYRQQQQKPGALDITAVERNLDAARSVKEEMEKEVEEATKNRQLVALDPKEADLEAGDLVYVMAPGPFYDRPARVVGYGGRGRLEVDLGGGEKTQRIKVAELSLPPEGSDPAAALAEKDNQGRRQPARRPGVSRKVQALLKEEEAATASRRGKTKASTGDARDDTKAMQVRTEANTLNVIGMRLEEAELSLDGFFAQCLSDGWNTCYILHGHGTGQLKRGLRDSLRKRKMVRSVKPASPDVGGDALTLVTLKA